MDHYLGKPILDHLATLVVVAISVQHKYIYFETSERAIVHNLFPIVERWSLGMLGELWHSLRAQVDSSILTWVLFTRLPVRAQLLFMSHHSAPPSAVTIYVFRSTQQSSAVIGY